MQTNLRIMIGAIAFMHISPLIIEDAQTDTFIMLKNVRVTIKIQEKAATNNVNTHTLLLRDCIIQISIKSISVSNIKARRKIAKKGSCAHLCTMILNLEI